MEKERKELEKLIMEIRILQNQWALIQLMKLLQEFNKR